MPRERPYNLISTLALKVFGAFVRLFISHSRGENYGNSRGTYAACAAKSLNCSEHRAACFWRGRKKHHKRPLFSGNRVVIKVKRRKRARLAQSYSGRPRAVRCARISGELCARCIFASIAVGASICGFSDRFAIDSAAQSVCYTH